MKFCLVKSAVISVKLINKTTKVYDFNKFIKMIEYKNLANKIAFGVNTMSACYVLFGQLTEEFYVNGVQRFKKCF